VKYRWCANSGVQQPFLTGFAVGLDVTQTFIIKVSFGWDTIQVYVPKLVPQRPTLHVPVPHGSRANITHARVPYFEVDYIPKYITAHYMQKIHQSNNYSFLQTYMDVITFPSTLQPAYTMDHYPRSSVSIVMDIVLIQAPLDLCLVQSTLIYGTEYLPEYSGNFRTHAHTGPRIRANGDHSKEWLVDLRIWICI